MGKMRAKPDPGVGPLGAEQFEWPVCVAGYERRRMRYILRETLGSPGPTPPYWVADVEPRNPSRVGDVLVPVGEKYRTTSPLKQADLFRRFAAIETAEQVEAFAGEYGLLGVPVDVTDPESRRKKVTWKLDAGESVDDWLQGAAHMRVAVEVWEVWQSGNWRRGIHVDLVRTINDQISRRCAPLLVPRPFKPDSFVLRMAPLSLYGAMWWQLARLFSGDAVHRPCKVCGRLIELGTEGEGKRVDAELCSAACKAKDHRARVRQAKELRAEGKSVREIVEQLDKPMKVIKNWLTKQK